MSFSIGSVRPMAMARGFTAAHCLSKPMLHRAAKMGMGFRGSVGGHSDPRKKVSYSEEINTRRIKMSAMSAGKKVRPMSFNVLSIHCSSVQWTPPPPAVIPPPDRRRGSLTPRRRRGSNASGWSSRSGGVLKESALDGTPPPPLSSGLTPRMVFLLGDGFDVGMECCQGF